MTTIKRIVLESRPLGEPSPKDVRLEDTELREAAEGDVIVRRPRSSATMNASLQYPSECVLPVLLPTLRWSSCRSL